MGVAYCTGCGVDFRWMDRRGKSKPYLHYRCRCGGRFKERHRPTQTTRRASTEVTEVAPVDSLHDYYVPRKCPWAAVPRSVRDAVDAHLDRLDRQRRADKGVPRG